MKKIIAFTLTLLLCLSLSALCLADDMHLYDGSGLLNEEDASYISGRLDEISEKHGCDIVIITTDRLGGMSSIDYADNFYLSHEYGDNGVSFLVSMDEREWLMSLFGDCYGRITDSGITYTSEYVLPYLSAGEYREAFEQYIEACDYLLDCYAQSGEAYGVYEGWEDIFEDDYYEPYEESSGLDTVWILISLGAGLFIALVWCGSMKRSMKTVRSIDTASVYEKQGSMVLTENRDVFLYANVARVPKPKDDDHSDFGGSGFGGGGVSFGSSGHSHSGGGRF